MGRTWPNVDAETVVNPGYYWNERLKKLARLQAGEKLPNGVGPWEMVAHEGEASSSQVTRRLFDRYPGMNINEFTYTTTSPLPRRLPMGDPPTRVRRALLYAGFTGVFVAGAAAAWWLTKQLDALHERQALAQLKKELLSKPKKERPWKPAYREVELRKFVTS